VRVEKINTLFLGNFKPLLSGILSPLMTHEGFVMGILLYTKQSEVDKARELGVIKDEV
jgi:hypothetical protein